MASPAPGEGPGAAARPRAAAGSKGTNILRGATVSSAGGLGSGWTDADVARWTHHNGGRFVASLAKDGGSDGVSHLLCTLDEFRKPRARQGCNLQRALARGPGTVRGGVHVVLRDWLEDSLHKRRRQRERSYLLRNVLRASQQDPAAAQQRLAEQRARGRLLGETFVDTSLYRIYRDGTGFAYKATIRRDNAAANIFGERYVLYLFESTAKPHLYWFAARHYKSRAHTKPRDHRPSTTCQLFATEFAHFCAFFLKKTGVAWDARLVGQAPAHKRKPGPAAGLAAVAAVAAVPARVERAGAAQPGTGAEPILPAVATAAAALASCRLLPDAALAAMPAYFTYDRPAKGMPVGAIEDEKNRAPDEGDGAAAGGQ